ncbi:CocE/NonD family hydrolase [Mesobacillus harenae]|uniref:CocE/NonD family hydrolase n=1 Tax=Mesobacillus harenae TaxID=2213203 RepID=UPI0015800580|nr:CocE/NonD family hydrolase [Mesobacillus harenae]
MKSLQNDKILVKKNIEILMRDQTVLRADLYIPDRSSEAFPCLIQRTPYDKSQVYKKSFPPMMAASKGFAVLVQDTRGRFESDGEFKPYQDDAKDGFDTIEWAAQQPWCNGKVGMYGGSYVGATQLLAATEKPPHLVTIFPTISSSLRFDGWAYSGGAFKLINLLGWTLVMIQHTAKRKGIQLPDSLLNVFKGLDELHHISFSSDSDPEDVFKKTDEVQKIMDQVLRTLPLEDIPIPTELGQYFFERIQHWKDDEYWKQLDITKYYNEISIPMIHLGGWYDMFDRHTIENFKGFSGGSAYQKLVMGPWSHGMFSKNVGEVDFGPNAEWRVKLADLHQRWFEYWLKDMDHSIEQEAPIQIFVMGENCWRNENEWPLKRTEYVKWYLHSSGNANTMNGNGVLSKTHPIIEPEDSFDYNPINPVPSKGGNILPLGMNPGARDQREIEEREDVLVYTSEPLEVNLEITGPLLVKLWASTDAVETDFTAKLIDVHPDGFAQNIQNGIIRTSFRESNRNPRLIKPHEVYEYEINLSATSNLFKEGHRIRIEISSSNFPHYSRNLNTGSEHHLSHNIKVAHQKIYHDWTRPSHIILPVIPRTK